MAMAGVLKANLDNFKVIASYDALKVLLEDEYFQDLPPNWLAIIGKVLDKLTPRLQSAKFRSQLSELTSPAAYEPNNKSALPDAVRHLIAALNNGVLPQSASSADLKLEFGRSYTPHALNSKMPRQQAVKNCREEEQRPEERFRHRLTPRLVN